MERMSLTVVFLGYLVLLMEGLADGLEVIREDAEGLFLTPFGLIGNIAISPDGRHIGKDLIPRFDDVKRSDLSLFYKSDGFLVVFRDAEVLANIPHRAAVDIG